VWGVKPWNGFEEFVRQRVLSVDGKRGEWRDDINYTETVFPIWPAVAKDRYAIGYAGLAYVADGVNFVALSPTGSAPFLLPGYEEVARADYPLSRLCFMNLNRAPDKPVNPVLAELLRFILSREGQRVILDEAIFLPLRESQAAKSRAQLN
jgi:phosphate transport system substrate-binding protein